MRVQFPLLGHKEGGQSKLLMSWLSFAHFVAHFVIFCGRKSGFGHFEGLALHQCGGFEHDSCSQFPCPSHKEGDQSKILMLKLIFAHFAAHFVTFCGQKLGFRHFEGLALHPLGLFEHDSCSQFPLSCHLKGGKS